MRNAFFFPIGMESRSVFDLNWIGRITYVYSMYIKATVMRIQQRASPVIDLYLHNSIRIQQRASLVIEVMSLHRKYYPHKKNGDEGMPQDLNLI